MTKKNIVLVLLILLTKLCLSQEEKEYRTIFGKDLQHSAYGAFRLSLSEANDRVLVNTGGYLSWLINQKISIGGFGYGIIGDYKRDKVLNDKSCRLDGAMAGLFAAYTIKPNSPIHFSIPLSLGFGQLSYGYANTNKYESLNINIDEDNFWAAEIGLELEANVFDFMRISAFASYRYSSDINLFYTKNNFENSRYSMNEIISQDILKGVTLGFFIKLGGF